MTKPRVVFLGTPDFSAEILQDLVDRQLIDLVGLWTKPPKPKGRGLEIQESALQLYAKQLQIPCQTSPRLTVDDEELLKNLKADLALVIAFGQILKPSFFNLPTYGTFNLHFSLLPKYRGASPVPSAILSGDHETGVTLQKIAVELDAGDIARRESFALEELRAPEVFAKSIEVSKALFTNFFNAAPHSYKDLAPQNHAEATFCRKIEKSSGQITPSHTVQEVLRKLRAYEPWPGIYVSAGEKRLQVLKVAVSSVPLTSQLKPGSLTRIGKKELLLVLQDGCLMIEELKPEGKKEMAVGDYLNSQPKEFVWELKDLS